MNGEIKKKEMDNKLDKKDRKRKKSKKEKRKKKKKHLKNEKESDSTDMDDQLKICLQALWNKAAPRFKQSLQKQQTKS